MCQDEDAALRHNYSRIVLLTSSSVPTGTRQHLLRCLVLTYLLSRLALLCQRLSAPRDAPHMYPWFLGPSPIPMTVKVAFVCLGNICRSPMAEAVFADTVKQAGLGDVVTTDSFGTGAYHVGEQPDRRSAAQCRKHNVPVNHRAQQIFPHHFTKFDYILAMDESNLRNLERLRPKNSTARLQLFGDYRGDSKFRRIVDDPYYGGDAGFAYNFEQCRAFSKNLLDQIEAEL